MSCFKNQSTALLISETAILLEHIAYEKTRMKQTTNRTFLDVSLDYCNRFATLNQMARIGEVQKFLSSWKSNCSDFLYEEEIIMLGNLWPSTSEEAKSLMNSLERIPDEE